MAEAIEREVGAEEDPDGADDDVKALAERIYFGLHPALAAIGISYAQAERATKLALVQKAARLRAFLNDDAQVSVVLNILFDRHE